MALKLLFGYNFGKLSLAAIPQDQAKADKEDWIEVHPSTLPEDIADAYEIYKEAYREMKDYRLAFEAKMRAHLGVTEQAKPVAKPKLSLSEYLARRA